jgi:hypothetical protein
VGIRPDRYSQKSHGYWSTAFRWTLLAPPVRPHEHGREPESHKSDDAVTGDAASRLPEGGASMHGWPMTRSGQVWEVALVLSWPSGSSRRLMVAGARGEGCQTGRAGGASSRNPQPDAVSSPTSSSRNVQRCPARTGQRHRAPTLIARETLKRCPTGRATTSRCDAHRPETLKRSPTPARLSRFAKGRQLRGRIVSGS